MLLHPIDAIEAEILPSGAVIFTAMELTVIALARSEKGRTLGSRGALAQALFTIEQRLTGGRSNWTLADARLEALRGYVGSLHRRGDGATPASQSLQQAGFSSVQETWLRSECAQPL